MQLYIGIDPGLRSLGYAAVKKSEDSLSLIFIGSLAIKDFKEDAVVGIYDFFEKMLSKDVSSFICYEKCFLCLEVQFVGRNVASAFSLVQVRTIFLLLARKFNFKYIEKSPTEIKKIVTGYGLGMKEDVSYVLKTIFSLDRFENSDESDALAIAFASALRG